jgi:hypothetical protein
MKDYLWLCFFEYFMLLYHLLGYYSFVGVVLRFDEVWLLKIEKEKKDLIKKYFRTLYPYKLILDSKKIHR